MERKIYLAMMVVSIITMFVTVFVTTQLFYDFYLSHEENNLSSILEVYMESGIRSDIEIADGTSIRIYKKSELPQKLENTSNKDMELNSGQFVRISKPIKAKRFLLLSSLTIFTALSIFAAVFLHIISSYLADELMYPIKLVGKSMENILDDRDISKDEIYPEFKPFVKNINLSREKIRYYMDKMEGNEKFRREFTANISHELKTPLTSINGFAELLEHGLVDYRDVPEMAGRISQEGQRLLYIIDDIIALSNLDSPEVDMDFQNINLLEIINDISDRLEERLLASGIELIIEGEDAIISASDRMIKDLIYNLLDNAIKYNKKNGYIYIGLVDGYREVSLIIKDGGIGIGDKDLDRIFERFYMVEESRTKFISGTGLGLSIVKNIVEIHDANIDITSKLDIGTEVEILFKKRPIN